MGAAFTSGSLDLGFGNIHRPGPGFLPFYTGAGLSLLALFALVQSLRPGGGESAERWENPPDPALFKAGAIVASMIAYSTALPWLGFFASTLALLMLLFRVAGSKRWLHVFAAALLATSFSYVVFLLWLGVRFPKGVLGF